MSDLKTEERKVGIEAIADAGQRVMAALSQVVVGQVDVLEELVVALFAGGHVLLEGPPGTAKTLMVHGMARALGGRFRRVQFTPDLMPADVLGTYVLAPGRGEFALREGPVFTDLLLADEINRAPPRTQAALLEAMQERQVTLDGTRHPLSSNFFVVATQNPLEYEGTYPLPEAQLDRFLFKLRVDYPSADEELKLLARFRDGHDPTGDALAAVEVGVELDQLTMLRRGLSAVGATDEVLGYISALVRASRRWESVWVGAGPRASVALFQAARARAALRRRDYITPDDVKRFAGPVLRHRLLLRTEAALDGLTADAVIVAILRSLKVPR